jgi:hypothetical protein
MLMIYFTHNFLTNVCLWQNQARVYICILVTITAPWRWQEYRPKHGGEKTVNEVLNKHWSVFVCLFIYCTSVQHYDVTLRRFCAKIVAVESNKYYVFWVCLALLIRHVMRKCRIMLSVACRAVLYFSTLSHKRREISYIFFLPLLAIRKHLCTSFPMS